MKKSIIALAVAGSIAAPMVAQADATLYGRVHERIVFQEDKDMNVQNAEARLGVKGSSEMDSGLTSFYQIEMALRGDSGTTRQSNASRQSGADTVQVRQLNAGVKGDFGKVTIGRFTNPLVNTYAGDIFEGESGPYQLAPFRVGNAISYSTPSLSGVSGSLTVIGEGEGDSSTYEDVDGYILHVGGDFGPISVDLAYMDTEYTDTAATADESEVASIGIAYNANNLYVGLGYEDDDKADKDVLDFGVKYTVGKTAFGLGYAVEDYSNTKEENERVVLGVYHDLGGSADVYTEFANHENKDASGADSDFNRVSIGYRVKF